jgi:hypothetical protein
MELTKEQRIMQQVISRAWNDDSYKTSLMTDPQAAIEKLTGEKITLPKGKSIAAVDQSDPNVIYINIPPYPNMDDLELSDKDLEMIAGGTFPILIIDGCFPTFPPKIPIPD